MKSTLFRNITGILIVGVWNLQLSSCQHVHSDVAGAEYAGASSYDIDKDSAAIYQAYSDFLGDLGDDDKTQLLAALRSAPLLSAYDALTQQIGQGGQIKVSGTILTLDPSAMQDSWNAAQALQQSYPTQGNLWDAQGIDPFGITADQFATGISLIASRYAASSQSSAQGQGLVDLSSVADSMDQVTRILAAVGAVLQAYNAIVEFAFGNAGTLRKVEKLRASLEVTRLETELLQAACEREAKTLEYQNLMAQNQQSRNAQPMRTGALPSLNTDSGDSSSPSSSRTSTVVPLSSDDSGAPKATNK